MMWMVSLFSLSFSLDEQTQNHAARISNGF